MTAKTLEYIIDKMKEILDEDLPSKLTELNAEYDDNITLLTPIVYEYEKELKTKDNIISIYGIKTSVLQEQLNWQFLEHQIALTIWVLESKGEDIITKKVYRYIRAVYEILASHIALDCIVTDLNFDTINYTPLYKSKKEKSFLQGATIIVLVRNDKNI